MNNLIVNLKDARGINNTEVSRLLSVSAQTVSNWVTGRGKIPVNIQDLVWVLTTQKEVYNHLSQLRGITKS